jgi:perosamine synthetase
MPFEAGATSVRESIPLSSPSLHGNELTYLRECIETGWVSSGGPFVERFEAMIAALLGTRYAVATASGTAALHVALQVAGVGPDDEVLIPTLTFIAPANAVRYLGAWPVLMDAEPSYWQIDVQKMRDFFLHECSFKNGILYNKASGRPVKAIVPVHVLGHPCEMDSILEFARSFNLKVIEDATESLGSAYRGRPTGSMGDLGCLSFNGNKIITTGGGGAITTNDEGLARKARYLTTQAKDDPFEYVHNEIGYNYRMTNLQAAVGVAQIEQLALFVQSKQETASIYDAGLSSVEGVTVPREAPWARSNRWLYTILVDANSYRESSRMLAARLKRQGIEARPFWRPVHQQVPYQNCQQYRIEVADHLYRDGISLPCSTHISAKARQAVIDEVSARPRSILRHAAEDQVSSP